MSQATHLDPVTLGLEKLMWLGADEVMGLCPFHPDHSPSLCLNLVKGVYICYVCGARGAAAKLAMALGGRLTLTPRPLGRKVNDGWRQLLSSSLALGHPYLQRRGVTEDQVRAYGILAVPGGVGFILHRRGGGSPLGLLVRRDRTPKGWARYVNYGDRPDAWPMQEALALGGQPYAVTEGVFGALAGLRAGIPTVALLGASVQRESSWVLNRGECRVLFDNDQAGYLGAGRVLRLAPMAKVLLPGAEADELDADEWQLKFNGLWTRSLARLATLYGDHREFWEKLPSKEWGWSKTPRRAYRTVSF